MELVAIERKPLVESINDFISWLQRLYPHIYSDCYVAVNSPTIRYKSRWVRIVRSNRGWWVEWGHYDSCRSLGHDCLELDPEMLLSVLVTGERK